MLHFRNFEMNERDESCTLIVLLEGLEVQKDAVRLLNVVPVSLHVEHRVHAVLQARVRRTQSALFDHLFSHSDNLIPSTYEYRNHHSPNRRAKTGLGPVGLTRTNFVMATLSQPSARMSNSASSMLLIFALRAMPQAVVRFKATIICLCSTQDELGTHIRTRPSQKRTTSSAR